MIGTLPEAELIHIILIRNGRNLENTTARMGIKTCGINSQFVDGAAESSIERIWDRLRFKNHNRK